MENNDLEDKMEANHLKKGMLYVTLSALGFSIIPILATLGFSADMAAGTMLFYRFFIAACFFIAYCFFKHKSLFFQDKKTYGYLILAGCIYSTQCILFFSAFRYVTAAVGEIIFYIYPIFVAVLSVIFLKEKMTKYKVIGIAIAVLGVGIVLYAPGGNIPVKGVVLIIFSALASSCYFIFNKKFTNEIEAPVLMVYICLTCSAVYFVYSIARGEFLLPKEWTVWIYIALLAIWSTVIGLFCLMKGLKLLEAGMASLVSLSEAIFTIILSYIILGTSLTPIQLMGAAIVIAAIYIYERE
ncbi:DMT family transporter [Aminipila luticellarii]|uniref:DMT family transporter n=1 Tax=Aminipila luticellarii TaxID=2507160 RepID=A0A410PXI7_9FIRM|nr:DMT family transporter [Aminipila luticellarii]QAT43580.1 DMT family transporter [Aminipila luticellarii]